MYFLAKACSCGLQSSKYGVLVVSHIHTYINSPIRKYLIESAFYEAYCRQRSWNVVPQYLLDIWGIEKY